MGRSRSGDSHTLDRVMAAYTYEIVGPGPIVEGQLGSLGPYWVRARQVIVEKWDLATTITVKGDPVGPTGLELDRARNPRFVMYRPGSGQDVPAWLVDLTAQVNLGCVPDRVVTHSPRRSR